MSGVKIRQMKQALVTILDELSPDDEFGIITFSSGVKQWKEGEILPASLQNIEQAKLHAETLIASGGEALPLCILCLCAMPYGYLHAVITIRDCYVSQISYV